MPADERPEVRVAEPVEQGLGDLAAGRVPVAHEEDADGDRARLAAIDGFECALEVDELDLETLQLLALPRDVPPLLLERRGQGGVGDLAFEAPVDEPSCLDRGEAEAPEREDQRQPGEVGVAVLAVAVLASHGAGEDPGRLVPADS